ncbi:hypothetical protein ACA910_021432 [Epithemia clementina (nom. ined.)]
MVQTKFNVGMTCEGCSNAVKRILKKIEGVQSVDADLEGKTVTVEADPSVSPESMLEALKKWGSASGKHVELAA